MGLYRTAIVQGLSIAHGRGERRQFSPVKTQIISIPLEDTCRSPYFTLYPPTYCTNRESHTAKIRLVRSSTSLMTKYGKYDSSCTTLISSLSSLLSQLLICSPSMLRAKGRPNIPTLYVTEVRPSFVTRKPTDTDCGYCNGRRYWHEDDAKTRVPVQPCSMR